MNFMPTKNERRAVRGFVDRLRNEVFNLLRRKDMRFGKIVPVGSIPKDTFVSGDYDVDIYIFTSTPAEVYAQLALQYPLGKKKIGQLLIWNTEVGEYNVDFIVVKPGMEKREDTIKHTKFYNKYLSDKMKREVITAKAYFKTEGVYGAEIGGITGVAIEELIRLHGTFENMCKYLVASYVTYKAYYPRDKSKQLPTVRDPTMKKERNLLANILDLRWKQIAIACRKFLLNPKFEYKPIDIWDFRDRCPFWWEWITFERKRDTGMDFHIIHSMVTHVRNMMRSLDKDIPFDYDVYTFPKRTIVLFHAPKKMSDYKIIEADVFKMRAAHVKAFKAAHPEMRRIGDKLVAVAKRPITNPADWFLHQLLERSDKKEYRWLEVKGRK